MAASGTASTVEVDPRTDERWADLQRRGGGLFTSPAWARAVTGAYPFTPSARLLVNGAGEATAGIAYCEIDDIRGRRIVSFPFADYHQPLGGTPAERAELLRTFSGPVSARFRVPEGAVSEPLGEPFERRSDLLMHRIEVDPSLAPDDQFEVLHPKVRQNIRRSRRAGIETELSHDPAALREFYDLHVSVRTRKYRLLPQPFSFFESIYDAFASSGGLTVALARHEGRAIAGIVYLEYGDTLYYKFNASDADGLNVRPNEQLVLAGTQICAERGLTGVDLGISDTDQEGLVRYKRKFAHTEVPVVTLTTPASVTDPCSAQAGAVGALLPQLTDLFTDEAVPAAVAERAGALLYRYFA